MSSTIRGGLPADNLNLAELLSAIYPDESHAEAIMQRLQPAKEAPIQFEDDASIAPSGNQY